MDTAFIPIQSTVVGTWNRPPESWAKLSLAFHMGLCMVFKAAQGIPVAGQQRVHPLLSVTGAKTEHGGGVAGVWGCQCCLGSQGMLLAPEGDFLVLRAVSSSVTRPHPLQCRTLTGMVCSCSAAPRWVSVAAPHCRVPVGPV